MPKISKQTMVRVDKVMSWSPWITRLSALPAAIIGLGIILCSGECFGATAPGTNSVKLAWNKSTSTNVTSYRVFYGATSGSYSNSVGVGNTTNNTIGGLVGGVVYFFAVAAYNASGVVSAFSNEISFAPTIPAVLSSVATNKRGVVTVRGLAGSKYDILATQNLTSWTLIGSVTLGVSGTLNFTDPNAANFARRFYRVQQAP